MEDRGPETKPEEQYPLLKVDGAGDSPLAQTELSPGWAVQCSRKNWCSRWPELIYACWMTLILFGISFLVFYALGMGAYQGNSSKPATNVFYHHLLPNFAKVPFLQHSEYLSYMAKKYPNLRFQVYYLVDDSRLTPDRYFMNKPIYNFVYKMNENSRQALVEFQKRYPNVNVCIMPLTKYMSETPLRFKWRSIPTAFLPFYARAFSVWENGGIGMVLSYHSFFDDNLVNSRRAIILKQHNDGINTEAYANALNKIENEEDNAIFALLVGAVNRFLNETRSFINRTLSFSPVSEPKSDVLLRSHRAKRDLFNNSMIETNLDAINITAAKPKRNNSLMDILTRPCLEQTNKTFVNNSKVNATSAPQVIFFDFHNIISYDVGPSYDISEALYSVKSAPKVGNSRSGRDVKRAPEPVLLSMDTEGTFIAASARLHPLLGHMISAACQRMAPKLAIQDAILSQCSGALKNDLYCDNIYIM